MKTLLRSRVLAWVLTLAMVVTFMPTMAFAAPQENSLWSSDYQYTKVIGNDWGTVTVTIKATTTTENLGNIPLDYWYTKDRYYKGVTLTATATADDNESLRSSIKFRIVKKGDPTTTYTEYSYADFATGVDLEYGDWIYLFNGAQAVSVDGNNDDFSWRTHQWVDNVYVLGIGVPEPLEINPEAIRVPLVDSDTGEDFKETTGYETSGVYILAQSNNNRIDLKATNLPKYKRGNDGEGYWIGFGVRMSENDDATCSINEQWVDVVYQILTNEGDEDKDGKHYKYIYFDASDYLDFNAETSTFSPKTNAPVLEYNGVRYKVNFSGVTLDISQTVTDLTVTPADQIEGQNIKLTADVARTFDNSKINYGDGVVRFYEDYAVNAETGEESGTFLGEVALDSSSQASLTIPAGDFDSNDHEYTAVFVYVGSEPDKYRTSSDSESYTSKTSAIQTKDFSKAITTNPAMDASGKLTVGTDYTLSIPDVYLMGQTNKLTNGQEYTVEWQWSTDGGTWNAMADNTDSITVSPPNAQTKYRAVIKPLSPYAKACEGMTEATEETPAQPKYTDDNTLVMDELESAATQTTIELAVSDYASEDGENLTEYEGEPVTLTATVKYGSSDNPNPVGDGFVYFYKKVDGEMIKINEYPVVVLDGVAQITNAQISAYDIDKGQTENKDVFTAEFKGSDIFAPSGMSNEMTVLIRSTKLAVPVIKTTPGPEGAASATTETAAIKNLPAGTAIAFELVGPVKALDGREIAAADGYTYQWEQNSNQGMFVPIDGATSSGYSIDSGLD